MVRVIVYPPPPRKPVKVISPLHVAIKFVPSGAGISTPLWKVEAPDVGAFLFPNGDEIYVYPGIGQAKLVLP